MMLSDVERRDKRVRFFFLVDIRNYARTVCIETLAYGYYFRYFIVVSWYCWLSLVKWRLINASEWMNEWRKEGRKERTNERTNERMTTATDWAQVNTTKSEGSSAICGPRTWKSMGKSEKVNWPLDPVAPRPLLSATEPFRSLVALLRSVLFSQIRNSVLLTNRATRLEVSQCHQTLYHSICWVWFPSSVL